MWGSYSCCLCYIFDSIVTDDSMIISKIAGQGHQHEACNHYPLFASALCLVFAIAFLSKYIKYRPDQKQYYKGHYSFYHGMNSENTNDFQYVKYANALSPFRSSSPRKKVAPYKGATMEHISNFLMKYRCSISDFIVNPLTLIFTIRHPSKICFCGLLRDTQQTCQVL